MKIARVHQTMEAARTFDSNVFSWSNREGFAFASDLGYTADLPFPRYFHVRSTRTGVTKFFMQSYPVYASGGEGELTGMMYRSDNIYVQLGND